MSRKEQSQLGEVVGKKEVNRVYDRGWAEHPELAVNNVHKLTEVEMMKLLRKVVTLPEKKLKQVLKSQNKEDPVLTNNLIERIPHYLTDSLVQIVKVCGKNHEIMKKSQIWDHLELEFLKRSSKLNNQQLVDVLFAFACAGKGSKKFFNEMGVVVVTSPIEFEENHLYKFLKSFSQVNYGSPRVYKYLSKKLIEFKHYLTITRMAEICAEFSKATNSEEGGFGFYEFVENEVKQSIYHNRLQFSEGAKICENLFKHNIGSTEFQTQLEEHLSEKIEHEKIPELLNISRALYDPKYIVKHSKLNEDLCTALTLNIDELSIRQLEFLFWSVTRDHKLYNGIKADNNYSKMLTKALFNSIYKRSVSLKSRGLKYVVNGIHQAFPDLEFMDELGLNCTKEQLYDRFEKVAMTKLQDFTNHDMLNVLESFLKLGVGSDNFYERIFSRLIDRRKELRPREFIRLFETLPKVQHIYENTVNDELWSDYFSSVGQPVRENSLPISDLLSILKTYVSLYNMRGDHKLFEMVLGQIRAGVYQIPAEKFSETMTYLTEAHVTSIAEKFLPILEQVKETEQLLEIFNTDHDRIRLIWSLLVLDKASEIIPTEVMKEMVNGIRLDSLEAFHFKLLMQILNLALSHEEYVDVIDYTSFYSQLNNLDDHYKEYILNHELASQSGADAESELQETVKAVIAEHQNSHKMQGFTYEIYTNFMDDFLNCFEVVVFKLDSDGNVTEKIAIIPPIPSDNKGQHLKKSEFIKQKIMKDIIKIGIITFKMN